MKKNFIIASIFLCSFCFVSCEDSSSSLPSNGIVGSVWAGTYVGFENETQPNEYCYFDFDNVGKAHLWIYDANETATYSNHYVTCGSNTQWKCDDHYSYTYYNEIIGLDGVSISVNMISKDEAIFTLSSGPTWHFYRVKGFKNGEKWSF